jgi:hypothetical protein
VKGRNGNGRFGNAYHEIALLIVGEFAVTGKRKRERNYLV